jgi:hypothetical protein
MMAAIKILIIFVLMLALLISTLLLVQKSYALKEVEANYVYDAISTILNDSHSVKIHEKNYTIDSRIIDALHLFPEYFKGGLIGPNAFPDMFIGQGLIHPDSRCQNGQEVEWQHCRSGTFSYEWLRHIYDSGWEYYDIRNADNESQKAIAFTYGILTHAAKDMWFNTLVNEFSRGIFPISTSNQTDVNSSLVNVIRHVIISSYIKKHSPIDNTILEMKSPKDFIFRTFIEDKFYDSTNKTSKGLGRGYLVDYLVDLRDRLVQKSNYYKNVENIINNSTKEEEIAQSKKEYLDAWIKHVNLGLYEWPQMSQDVAHAIFVENNNYDRAMSLLLKRLTD